MNLHRCGQYHSLKEFPAANASISPWWKTTRIGISCSRVQNTASIHTFDAPSSPVSCPWWTYQSKWMMCPKVNCPNKTLRSKINLSKVNSFSCNPASVKDCLRMKNVSIVKQYWTTKNVKHTVWYPFVGFLDKQTPQKKLNWGSKMDPKVLTKPPHMLSWRPSSRSPSCSAQASSCPALCSLPVAQAAKMGIFEKLTETRQFIEIKQIVPFFI